METSLSRSAPEKVVPGAPVAMVAIDETQLQKLEHLPEVLNRLYKNMMQEGTDYGKIPGTPKPSLFKPGAELLNRAMNLVPVSLPIKEFCVEDREAPYFAYSIETRFYNVAGEVVGNGLGSANTKESRYAFRWIRKSKLKANQEVFDTDGDTVKIETPKNEIFTLQNTVLKMAEKRSFISGVLKISGASRIFTQDLTDDEGDEPKSRNVARVKSSEAEYEQKTPAILTAASPSSSPAAAPPPLTTTPKKGGRDLLLKLPEPLKSTAGEIYQLEVEFDNIRKQIEGVSYEWKQNSDGFVTSVVWRGLPNDKTIDGQIDKLLAAFVPKEQEGLTRFA